MAEITKHRDTAFSWAELMSTDTEAAKQFLSALFGWEMVNYPMAEGMTYIMCQLEGKNVAALYPAQPQMPQLSNWIVYVNVDDVEARYATAVEAGAATLMPPSQIDDQGRCAMIQDPTGATIGLWQAQKHIGAELHNIPGTIAWNELSSTDVEKTNAFYQQVFGWGTRLEDMVNGSYTMWTLPDGGIAGMMPMPDGINLPSYWSVYFNVFDVAESAAQAESLGATILMPTTLIDNVGTIAIVQSEAIGTFYLFKSAN